MKLIKLQLVNGERLKCDICSKWIEKEYLWIHINENGGLEGLLCEECQEKEEKDVSE